MDAIQYRIPSGPVVLFFNNPFGQEVMAPMLENIQRSMEEAPREVYVVYAHPRCLHLLERNPAYRKLVGREWYVIYQCVGAR